MKDRFIEQLLGRYILEKAEQQGTAFLDEVKEIPELSILFLDLFAYTAMSERLSPPELVKRINSCHDLAAGQIIACNGFVANLIGDGIFAIFGLEGGNSHACDACRAALAIRDAFVQTGSGGLEKALEIGAGINTGPAMVGCIGSKYRKIFTALGPQVNLAFRMNALNSAYKTQILCSEHTQRMLDSSILTREIDNVAVKGIEAPLAVFEVLADRR
ncbi:MAG: adenylate/guanylate cyclase domain-containing protein [Spirochaetales bacterium]|nr:adenylate/guanylate cyclase domain-containing protein [Spirochaetales bacterium]